MNRLSTQQRKAVVSALVEGNSVRATSRMTGVSKTTILKLLGDLGTVCSVHQDRVMRDLTCERIQCDEVWAFCHAKARNVPAEKRGQFGYGDVWTWVALDADTKLVPTYRVGARDLEDAYAFVHDLAGRLRHRVQLTTDGFSQYVFAVERAFGGKIDYAQLQKVFGIDPLGDDRRYSPPIVTEIRSRVVSGHPDPDHVSTSYVERSHLTLRMSQRRFTRLTNGFSKKVENLAAAVSIHFFFYNFCRVHKTIGTTPAVAAGVTDHVWTLDEMIGLLEAAEATPIKRGPYKKRAA